MTEPTKAAITPDTIMAIVDQIDAAIPKVKNMVTQFQANPFLLTVASRAIPGLSSLVSFVAVAGPWINIGLDYAQKATDSIQAAAEQAKK